MIPRLDPKQADDAPCAEDADDPEGLDPVWRALANPVRRALLDALRDGPRTTGDLSDLHPDLSRFAVMQHLRVLTEAELVVVRREGRKRFNYLNPVPIQAIYSRWVEPFMRPWTEALVNLRTEIEGRSGEAGRPNSP